MSPSTAGKNCLPTSHQIDYNVAYSMSKYPIERVNTDYLSYGTLQTDHSIRSDTLMEAKWQRFICWVLATVNIHVSLERGFPWEIPTWCRIMMLVCYDVATMTAMYVCDTHVDLHIQNIIICCPQGKDMNTCMLYWGTLISLQ